MEHVFSRQKTVSIPPWSYRELNERFYLEGFGNSPKFGWENSLTTIPGKHVESPFHTTTLSIQAVGLTPALAVSPGSVKTFVSPEVGPNKTGVFLSVIEDC